LVPRRSNAPGGGPEPGSAQSADPADEDPALSRRLVSTQHQHLLSLRHLLALRAHLSFRLDGKNTTSSTVPMTPLASEPVRMPILPDRNKSPGQARPTKKSPIVNPPPPGPPPPTHPPPVPPCR